MLILLLFGASFESISSSSSSSRPLFTRGLIIDIIFESENDVETEGEGEEGLVEDVSPNAGFPLPESVSIRIALGLIVDEMGGGPFATNASSMSSSGSEGSTSSSCSEGS